LSMMVIIGAIRQAAEKPAVKSDANRRPKFLVFRILGSFFVEGAVIVGARVLGDMFALSPMDGE
jgi:hypothetical protein